MRLFQLFRQFLSETSSNLLSFNTALQSATSTTNVGMELHRANTYPSLPSLPSHCRDTTFDEVLAHINLEAVPQLATETRMRMQGAKTLRSAIIQVFRNVDLSCEIESQYMAGSFNILIPINFRDGVQWLLKVPANGGPRWNEQSSRALASEVFTMKYIRQNTSMPVPEIYGHDSTANNSIRCPYILMERIEASPCHRGWYRWLRYDIDGTNIEPFRERILGDLAKAMVQMNDLSFTKAGSLQCRESDNLPFVGPYRSLDHYAASARGSDETTNYQEQGPFTDPRQFFLSSLDKQDTSKFKPSHLGQLKALRLWIDWFFQITGERSTEFVLNSPDFNLQNILVGKDGSLKGLIDWDGVAAVPSCIGCEEYPLFLTQDWDPFWYNQSSEEEVPMPFDNNPVMSPEELDRYRAMYARAIEKALSEQGRYSPSYIPATKLSPLARSLYTAANEPQSQPDIIDMITNKIIELTRDDEFEDSGHGSGSDRDACSGSDTTSEASIDSFKSVSEEETPASTIAIDFDSGGDGQDLIEEDAVDMDKTTKRATGDHQDNFTTGEENGLMNNHSNMTTRDEEHAYAQLAFDQSSATSMALQDHATGSAASALLHLLILPMYLILLFDWLQSYTLSPTTAILICLFSQSSSFLSLLMPFLGGLIFAKIIDVAFRSPLDSAKDDGEHDGVDEDWDTNHSQDKESNLSGDNVSVTFDIEPLVQAEGNEDIHDVVTPCPECGESPDHLFLEEISLASLEDANKITPAHHTASPASSVTPETIQLWHSLKNIDSKPLLEYTTALLEHELSFEALHAGKEDNISTIETTFDPCAKWNKEINRLSNSQQSDTSTESGSDGGDDETDNFSPFTISRQDLEDFAPYDTFQALYDGKLDSDGNHDVCPSTGLAYDLGEFRHYDIFHALYNGDLDKARMARMKVGFARLVAQLDRRYSGFDAMSLRG